jgi:hypothetical protein
MISKRSHFLLRSMFTAFALCIIGLVGSMLYYLYVVFVQHRTLEAVLGNSIPFHKALGGIGILGLVFFFAFLLSLMGKDNSGKS